MCTVSDRHWPRVGFFSLSYLLIWHFLTNYGWKMGRRDILSRLECKTGSRTVSDIEFK